MLTIAKMLLKDHPDSTEAGFQPLITATISFLHSNVFSYVISDMLLELIYWNSLELFQKTFDGVDGLDRDNYRSLIVVI